MASPASAAKKHLVEAGCAHLRGFGYETQVMPHALAHGPLYYAGTANHRAADLHRALIDDSVDGVVCTRGGWGSAELLPLLDALGTAQNLRRRPVVFVGYSDHTSLHAWLWNECRMRTFYGPMVAADWSKDDGVDARTWNAALETTDTWSVGEDDGLRTLQQGAAQGRLLGGCLSILCEALGTPWQLRLDEPTVLFCEDIATKPYKWDRLLQHLKYAGVMRNVAGVVLGDMSANVDSSEMELMEAACRHALGDFRGPISIGLRCGHVESGNRTLPLGAWVEMENATLREMNE